MELSELETTFGSYSPFLLRLSVNRLYDGMKPGERDPQEFSIEDEQATLFHEFIHHLQNISSIAGISHFNCLIAIWHSARNIENEPGDTESRSQLEIAIKNIQQYRPHKSPQALNDFKVTCIEDFNLTSEHLGAVKIKATDGNSDFEIFFGINEFFESFAYQLELLFRKQAGIQDNAEITKSIPYKLGRYIGEFHNPICSEMRLLLLMSTAMQHAAPHKAYLELVKKCAASNLSDSDLRVNLGKQVERLIEINKNWLQGVELQIKAGFPLKDPHFGDIIKELFFLMQQHLNDRIHTPFPELDFLSKMERGSTPKSLNSFITAFGGCMVFRDMGYILDNKEEDSFFVIGDKNSIFRQQKAWEIFQSSIHYSIAHTEGLVKNSNPASAPRNGARCPLFAYCCDKNKDQDICQSSPWLQTLENRCSYRTAVYIADLSNSVD